MDLPFVILVLRPRRIDLRDFEHVAGLFLGEFPSDLAASAVGVGIPPRRSTTQLGKRADPQATEAFA